VRLIFIKIYYQDKYVQLIQGDCLEIIDELIEEGIKFDAIITDPPYGTTDCSWDVMIPFKEMWDRIHKIAPKAPIVLFGKQPFTSSLIMSNINEFRENIIWLKNKSGNGFRANQRHIQVLEDIIVFSKEARYTFNPQKWLVEDKEFLTQRKTFTEVEVGNNIYSKIKRIRKQDTGERNPVNIVSCRVPFTPSKNKTYSKEIDVRYHPTQKPIKLMEYLIKTYMNEYDLILDFTCGSGTTLVTAQNLNRRCIGIELEEKYCEIAKNRLEKNLLHICNMKNEENKSNNDKNEVTNL